MPMSTDDYPILFHGLGLVHSPDDPHDHPLSAHLLLTTPTPRKVVPKVTIPVLDQGQTPRCVGYSGALQRIISEKIAEHETLRFDADDLYTESKKVDGDPTGEGTYIRSACAVLLHTGGLVSLSRAKGIHKGDRLKISAYSRLNSLQDIRVAVSAMGSAWIGVDWPNSWFDPGQATYGGRTTSVLPTPGKIAGGHAGSIIGYDDDFPLPGFSTGAALFQNNWSVNWGDRGRAWLPYRFINFDDGSFEAWRTFDTIGDK